MPWHALTLADLEFIEFRQALERAYHREIAVGGSRGYTLYGRMDALRLTIERCRRLLVLDELRIWKHFGSFLVATMAHPT